MITGQHHSALHSQVPDAHPNDSRRSYSFLPIPKLSQLPLIYASTGSHCSAPTGPKQPGRPGWPQTQRSVCSCLLNAGMEGVLAPPLSMQGCFPSPNFPYKNTLNPRSDKSAPTPISTDAFISETHRHHGKHAVRNPTRGDPLGLSEVIDLLVHSSAVWC